MDVAIDAAALPEVGDDAEDLEGHGGGGELGEVLLPKRETPAAKSASMVPRSHSRATTSAVNRAPTTVMMMVTEPGKSEFRLFVLGLNQARVSSQKSFPGDRGP